MASPSPGTPEPTMREREVDLSTRMTDHEALMWNVEKDPWLNPNGASLTILDQPVDRERFRAQLRYGITKMPRLYQRVVPGLGRFTPPTWAPDPEFDFDYHVREVSLPGPGSMRQLLDLAAQLYQEPLDRTRPLWRFVAISGIEGGRGAVYAMTHHVIADGIGQLRMAELYQQLSRDQGPPADVDLDAFLADVVERHGSPGDGDPVREGLGTLADASRETAGHLLRRQAGIGRRLVGEVMLWPADTSRPVERLGELGNAARSIVGAFSSGSGSGSDDGENGGAERSPSGSPLWRNRSRHRHLEHVPVPLDGLKAASKKLGGSINDGFMIGLTEGAIRYHEKRGTTVDSFNTSFVVSTRTDDKMGGNSFTPVPISVSGRPGSYANRMQDLRQVVEQARERSDHGGGLSGLSGLINLLPTSVVTQTARRQAATIDFATSNLRGAPFPLYCAGAKVEATVCMGPLAGTAVNATALSHEDRFDIGLFIDPVAIDDPADYRDCVESAFADLVALGAEKPAKKATKTTAKPATAGGRKKTSSKTASKKKAPSSKKKASSSKAASAKKAVSDPVSTPASANGSSANGAAPTATA